MLECVCPLYGVRATFNKVSVIPWWSVLLMEKAVARGENNDMPEVTDKLHNMVSTPHLSWIRTYNVSGDID